MDSYINYHALLAPKVLKLVTSTLYKADFTKRDKKELQGYAGSFILGVRNSGTNLLKFEKEAVLDYGRPIFGSGKTTFNRFRASVEAFVFSNDTFFIGENGNVRQVSKKLAHEYYRRQLGCIGEIYASCETKSLEVAA